METNRRTVLLALAIVAFVLAAVAGEANDGEALLTAVSWLGIGGALLAGAHLP